MFTIVVEGEDSVVRRRPESRIVLRPTAEDTFQAGGLGTIRFHRTGSEVTPLGVSQDRVFDLRFERVRAAAPFRRGRLLPCEQPLTRQDVW